MTASKFFKCKDARDTVYERLYSFKSEETGKNYMIFTTRVMMYMICCRLRMRSICE